MYLPQTFHYLGPLAVAAVIISGATGVVFAEQSGKTAPHDFHSMILDDCRLAAHDPAHQGGQTPADVVQSFADELGLSGQQQQDLKILTADYGERLRDLAKLMRESGQKLIKTEPGDPDYWPLAQEVSASAASNVAETIILISEMREKIHAVLTADQRAELKRRLEERMAQCKPQADTQQPTE